MNLVTWSFPTTIVFGRNALLALPQCLNETGIKKPLIVTDPGLRKTGICQQVEDVLKTAGKPFALFEGVHPNPVEDDVEQATAEVPAPERAAGHHGQSFAFRAAPGLPRRAC